MNDNNAYLQKVLTDYRPRDFDEYSQSLNHLKRLLFRFAGKHCLTVDVSGSRAKGTAIGLASDYDLLVSLAPDCSAKWGGLKYIYDRLFFFLKINYSNARRQNVSVRISLDGLEVDVTPAQKHPGNTNDHSLYVSKLNTRKQTNIQKHINDIRLSGRCDEIRLMKIWRELNELDFPSIYLEYLLVKEVLSGKPKGRGSLELNLDYCFQRLAQDKENPLSRKLIDPANSNNVLSDLLEVSERKQIIAMAKQACDAKTWDEIFYPS